MLNLYLFQGPRSGTLAMHHQRRKSGSYIPFSFTRASHQLLVPFLLPAQNPLTSPLTSSASHICALLSLPPFLIGAPCPMKSFLPERLDSLHFKTGESTVLVSLTCSGIAKTDLSVSSEMPILPHSSCTYVFSEVLSGLPTLNLSISLSQMFWSDISWSSNYKFW